MPKTNRARFTEKEDIKWMDYALKAAQQAADEDEVPVGAVVVYQNKVIATGFNQKESSQLVTAHAEIQALNRASNVLNSWRLTGCTLYVTLEPCLMCTGALIQSRIDRVVYATKEPKTGAIHSTIQLQKIPQVSHTPTITSGIREQAAKKLLSSYFKGKRNAS